MMNPASPINLAMKLISWNLKSLMQLFIQSHNRTHHNNPGSEQLLMVKYYKGVELRVVFDQDQTYIT